MTSSGARRNKLFEMLGNDPQSQLIAEVFALKKRLNELEAKMEQLVEQYASSRARSQSNFRNSSVHVPYQNRGQDNKEEEEDENGYRFTGT